MYSVQSQMVHTCSEQKRIFNTIEIPIRVLQQTPDSCKTFRDSSGIPMSRSETGNSEKLNKVAEENAFI